MVSKVILKQTIEKILPPGSNAGLKLAKLEMVYERFQPPGFRNLTMSSVQMKHFAPRNNSLF